MRKYENANRFKNDGIDIHNIIVTHTSQIDYEMSRMYLIEDVKDLNYGEFLLLEGSHCSCYDFDETEWEGIVYSEEELIKLSQSDYNKNSLFHQSILEYLGK